MILSSLLGRYVLDWIQPVYLDDREEEGTLQMGPFYFYLEYKHR